MIGLYKPLIHKYYHNNCLFFKSIDKFDYYYNYAWEDYKLSYASFDPTYNNGDWTLL